MSQYPPWTAVEDARLIKMREEGLTGQALYTTISERSIEAVRLHLYLLRRDRRVR
jgi:hypothetical protein